jgi:hypothetical protein
LTVAQTDLLHLSPVHPPLCALAACSHTQPVMGTACSCERDGDVDSAATVGQSQSVRHSQQELVAEDEAAAQKAATQQVQEVTRPIESENVAAAAQVGQPSGQAGNTSLPQVKLVCDKLAHQENYSDRSIDKQVCDERLEEIDSDPLAEQDEPAEQVVPNLAGVWKHTHDVT